MFSLLVGLIDGTVPSSRMFEHTHVDLRDRFTKDLSGLHSVPALCMPEVGDDRYPQVAQIGSTLALKQVNREHRFKFVPDPRFTSIPLSVVQGIASELGINDWEFVRTHWAVKEEDLFEALYASLQQAPGVTSPKDAGAVSFPTSEARDRSLVAVMMPFDPAFDIVYETISAAAVDAGMATVRVDDIWEQDHIMGDVASILWRAQVVVADLTGRNTNVFYEAGLAHALPRPTILLTQSSDDVPFDLKSIRYLQYGLGSEDRRQLRDRLGKRLQTLQQR